MSSALYVTAIAATMATLGVPLLAQENSPEMPPQTSSQPQPQMQPSRPSDSDNPRFAFHRIDGGFLRLDLRTGAVASCSQGTAEWTCIPGREERAALDREIARLQRDNAILKNALLEHGVPLPNDMKADQPPAVPRPPQTVPPATATPPSVAQPGEPDRASRDDAEIERIMSVMEKVWRRLVEIMMSIQRDLQKKG